MPTAFTFWSVGLTPAQSWIAEARRSRDLLVGSRLLAWSMGRLLTYLQSQGATIRLPQVEAAALASLSGKFIDSLSGSTAVTNHASGFLAKPLEEAKAVFAKLDGCLADAWCELHEDVATTSGTTAADLWKRVGKAIGRPRCPLQVVWALQEVPQDGSADDTGLQEVEAVYAAVKRSRPIPPHDDGAPVRKCGQCGKRESMGGPDPAKWRQFQADLAKLPEVKQGLRFEAGEYLCPVCALRRLAGYLQEEAFPSTSEIAASHWLWRICSTPDLRAALVSLSKATSKVPGFDRPWADRAPLYYQRSIDRERRRAREDQDQGTPAALDGVQAALRHLEKEIRGHNRGKPKEAAPIPEKPPEYLAVVMFDGDDFGERLRDDLDVLPPRVVDFQNRLAAYFADSGEDHPPRGRPFYLGGDEGLVLAPLAVVLDLAHDVKEIWDQAAGSTPAKATMSMGIALFDRERPLGAAIEMARRSLERAKRMRRPRRKDALAVSVQTASGSEWTAVAHWGESWERIAAAVKLIREGSLSSGWPHDVERSLRELPQEAFRGDEDSRAAIREEVKRITFRRTPRKSLQNTTWVQLNGDAWWQQQPPSEELEALADSLHLIAFLSRHAGPLAAPPAGQGGAP
jgi:CRISPR-associated protein Cmr2